MPLTKKRTAPRTKKNYSITPTFVENAKRPSQSQKAFWYWDKKLTGFGLKVYYTGRKVYGIRFILKGGKSRWIEIGPDGDPWNAKTARDEATLIAQNVMNGRTPMAHKVEREVVFATLRDLFNAYATHLDEMVGKGALAARTVAKYKRQWEMNVPEEYKVKHITELDVEVFDRLHTLITNPPVPVRKARRPVEANRTLDMLSAMLEWVLSLPERRRLGLKENAVRKVTQNVESDDRGIWLSDEDQAKLFEFLLNPQHRYNTWWDEERRARRIARARKIKRPERRRPCYVLIDTMVDALLVLFMTGLRAAEVMSLPWEAINDTRQTAKVQQNKQGAGPTEQIQHKRIYLPDEVLEILAKLPKEGPWVFPSAGRSKKSSSGHIANLQDAWDRVRTHLNLPKVRLHDFRHTVACELSSHPDGTVKNLQGAMGWATAQTALRYLHARQKHLDRMVQETASSRIQRLRGNPPSITRE